jgi:SH3-like domain-containing protein
LTGVAAGEQIFLRKIPRESAEPWLQLKDGTAVRIIEATGDYRLIETGLGVSGWVSSEVLLLDRTSKNGNG